MITGGRRGGKTTAYRKATEAAASAGQHVHALARDGQWCVTAQPVGFLWALIPPPLKPAREHRDADMEFYAYGPGKPGIRL